MTPVRSLSALVVAACVLFAAPAFAVTIIGSSYGTFSGLSSCDHSGNSQNCQITSSSNGPNTQVQWGSTSQNRDFINPSTLTAVDVNINRGTPATDVTIAQLDWYNSATWAQSDLNLFGVNWNLTIAFSAPSGGGDSEQFSLTITNPINPPGDSVTGLTLGDLANLSLTLAGVTVSDLRYSVVDGSGPGISTLTFNNGNGNWYNPEGNWSTLLITADFVAPGGSSGPSPVSAPAPGTLVLLGASLLGLSAWRRRPNRQ
jgi:hypothetical protein